MVRLTVAVQHHPSRAHLLPELLERLDGLDVRVVCDPEPDGKPSPWRCYLACLENIPAEATHLLIVQDDAIPCHGFQAAAVSALEARPDKPVAFFVAGAPLDLCGAILRAGRERQRWVDLSPYSAAFPCVASAWPADLVPEILAWAEQKGYDSRYRSDDGILAQFLQARKIWPLATVPPLVQHPDVEVSLIAKRAWGGKQRSRVACISPPTDAATIDWE